MLIERGSLFDAIVYALKHNHEYQYKTLYKIYKDSVESDKVTNNFSNYYNVDSMDGITKQYLISMLIGHHKENGNTEITDSESLIKNKIFVDKVVFDETTKIFSCSK